MAGLRYYDTTLDWFHLEVVRGCQLRCVGCPNSTINPHIEFAPIERIEAIMRNVDRVRRVLNLRLYNYGEPLLHPQLPEILGLTQQQRWRPDTIEISTNAQCSNWEAIARALETKLISRLYVSCDGDGTPEDYERLRPPAKWSRLVRFLERVADMRDALHPEMTLITRSCVETVESQWRWRDLSVPMGWRPEFRGFLLLPESSLQKSGRQPQPDNGFCFWVANRRNLFVDWDGEVLPCCAHPRAAELGNLTEKTLSQIVRVPDGARNQFFEDMLGRRAEMRVCGSCDVGPGELALVRPLGEL